MIRAGKRVSHGREQRALQEPLLGKSHLQTAHTKRAKREGGDLCAKSGTHAWPRDCSHRPGKGKLRECPVTGAMQRRCNSPFTSTRGAGPGTSEGTGMSASGLLFPFTRAIPRSLTTHSVKSQAAGCPSPQRCGMLPTLPLPQTELAPLQGSLPAPASCPSFLCLVSPSPLTTICCTGCPKNARKSEMRSHERRERAIIPSLGPVGWDGVHTAQSCCWHSLRPGHTAGLHPARCPVAWRGPLRVAPSTAARRPLGVPSCSSAEASFTLGSLFPSSPVPLSRKTHLGEQTQLRHRKNRDVFPSPPRGSPRGRAAPLHCGHPCPSFALLSSGWLKCFATPR